MNNYQEDYFFIDENELEVEEKKKYIVVIIYDVVDNKRRAKLAKYLKRYGFRVQRSSFEAIIDNKSYNELINNVKKYIKINEDLLRIYKISGNTIIKTWGSIGKTELDDVIII